MTEVTAIAEPTTRGLKFRPRVGSGVEGSTVASYAMLTPFLAVYAFFVLVPIVFGIGLSFTKWDGSGPIEFVGFANYANLAVNRKTIQAFGNLFGFVALQVPIGVAVGLALAVFIDRFTGTAATLLRAVLLLPFVMPLFLTAAIWLWMMVPQFGLFNQLTSVVGLGNVEWLSNPRYMVPALVIVETWRTAGFNMLLFYAGLKAIPRETIEAARIDGASTWEEIRHIILPQIAPITFIIAVNAFFGSFQIFDLPWLLSRSGFVEGQGGPGGGLLFPVMQSVASGFGSLRFGQGAAIGVLLLILILLTTSILFGARALWRRSHG